MQTIETGGCAPPVYTYSLADQLADLQVAALKSNLPADRKHSIVGTLFAAEVESRREEPHMKYIRNILKRIAYAPG